MPSQMLSRTLQRGEADWATLALWEKLILVGFVIVALSSAILFGWSVADLAIGAPADVSITDSAAGRSDE